MLSGAGRRESHHHPPPLTIPMPLEAHPRVTARPSLDQVVTPSSRPSRVGRNPVSIKTSPSDSSSGNRFGRIGRRRLVAIIIEPGVSSRRGRVGFDLAAAICLDLLAVCVTM